MRLATTRRIGSGAMVLVVVLLLASSARGQGPGGHGHTRPAPSSGAQTPYAAGIAAAMAQMAEAMHQAATTGDPDQDFLAMMIPHHEAAVEMARLVLVHGQDPMVRQLAEEIIAAQQAEIVTMTNRLAILRRGRDPNPGGFPALSGTRGPGAASQ